MKIKFSESFLSRLGTVGTTMSFSEYKVCALLKKDLLLDVNSQRQVVSGKFDYIWDDERKTMDLTFPGTEELRKETGSNPFVIYLFEDSLYEVVEGPALVLYGEDSSMLNLTGSGLNHITVKFPLTVLANIVSRVEGKNQKYLESKSNVVGTNIFVADGREDELVSKNSYLKYVRNKISTNNIPTYLNKDGKKIFSSSYYKRYKKINIYSSNLVGYKDSDGTQNYYLPSTSGTVTLSGECVYDLYEVKEGKFILQKENVKGDLSNVVLKGLGSIDQEKFKIVDNRTIEYIGVEDSSTTSFQGELYFKDEMKEGLPVPLVSNKINLYQYSTWGKPSTTTNLFEGGKHVFLFDSEGNAVGTSRSGLTRYHEIVVKLKKRVDPKSIKIIPSSPQWNEYFGTIITKLDEEAKSGAHPYSIQIGTSNKNTSSSWYPMSGGTSTLMSCTISLGPNNKIQFYCVQGPSLPLAIRDLTRTDSLEKNSKGNFVGHLDGIIGKKKSDYYVTSEKLVEGYNTWVCSYSFFNESVNFVDRRSGKIVETVGESGKISITSYDMPSTETEIEIGSITFKRAPTSGEIDNTNWRDVMYDSAGSCKLDLVMARDTSSSSYSTLTSSTQYFLKENDNSLKRLYMFDWSGKTFENTDNQDIAEHWFEFLVDENIPRNSIVLESGRLEEFFNIKVESAVESTKKAGWFRYRVIITAKGENNSDRYWLPTNSSNIPDIIKAKIELRSAINDHKIVEEFYCIQGFKIDPIKVYVENKKPEWIELTGTHGATSASNSGLDFEFESQEDFDKYTSNDSKLERHSVGDIITLGEIKSGIRKAKKFKMLVNTYKPYDSENDYIDFRSEGESAVIALSKPIDDYTHWKEVGIRSDNKLQVVSSNPDNLLNPEFLDLGDGKFVVSNSDKDLSTAKYKIELTNSADPVKTHDIKSTFIVDRVSDNTIKVEDLLSDWKYLMMKNNGVSTANIRTRVKSEGSEDNIIVRTDDNKLWNGINVLPLDYIGIYRIFVSCTEEFIVTLSGNDSLHFIDENNKVLKNTLSVEFDRTALGQYVPVYLVFEGGEKNSFRTPYQNLKTEINIFYKSDPTISKTVQLRRYYIDSIPSEDGKDLGSLTSTGETLKSSIELFGDDPISSALIKSGSGKDIFCTYNIEEKEYSFSLAYKSSIETKLSTSVSSRSVRDTVVDLSGFVGNKVKVGGKYDGSNKGYRYTKESVVYEEYPSKINQSYPIPVIDTVKLEQVGTGKKIEYNVYNRLIVPRVSISNIFSQPRYNNKIYVTPPTQNHHNVLPDQKLLVDISVPGQSFKVRVLRGVVGFKLPEDNKVYLNRYDKGPIEIQYKAPDTYQLTSRDDEHYIGTLEIESYIDKDNFILDSNRNIRIGNNSYPQEVVNLIAGTTKEVFDLYIGFGRNVGSESSRDYHTFSQEFSGIIPASGGKKTIELNPLFENNIITQEHDKTPYDGKNILNLITVESLFGKKFLKVDFASRASRVGYNGGIELEPSSSSIENFCNSTNLPKILALSKDRVPDNFSIRFATEGKETGQIVYDTAQQNPSFLQEPYTHGIIVSYIPTKEDGTYTMDNVKSRLFVGAEESNILTVKIKSDVETITRSLFDNMGDYSRYLLSILTAIYPIYVASAELPTSTGTQFGTQSSNTLIIEKIQSSNDYPLYPITNRSRDVIGQNIFNYYFCTLFAGKKEDIKTIDSFRISDGKGNQVTIIFDVDVKLTK